jgi:hypothetical protein
VSPRLIIYRYAAADYSGSGYFTKGDRIMRYCPECHEEFPDSSKFCPECECGLAYRPDPPEDGISQKVVTLATFEHPEEAALVKSRLESEGIWSSIVDNRADCALKFDKNVFFGIKLQVVESRAEEAVRVLLRASGNAASQ